MSRADFEFFESLDQLLMEQGIANEEAKRWLDYEVELVDELVSDGADVAPTTNDT